MGVGEPFLQICWKPLEAQSLLWTSKSQQEEVKRSQGRTWGDPGADFGPNLGPTWFHAFCRSKQFPGKMLPIVVMHMGSAGDPSQPWRKPGGEGGSRHFLTRLTGDWKAGARGAPPGGIFAFTRSISGHHSGQTRDELGPKSGPNSVNSGHNSAQTRDKLGPNSGDSRDPITRAKLWPNSGQTRATTRAPFGTNSGPKSGDLANYLGECK